MGVALVERQFVHREAPQLSSIASDFKMGPLLIFRCPRSDDQIHYVSLTKPVGNSMELLDDPCET